MISAKDIIVFTLRSQSIFAFDSIYFAFYRLHSYFIRFSMSIDLCEFVIILFKILLHLLLFDLEVRVDISSTLSYEIFELFYALFYFIHIILDSFVASFTDVASTIKDFIHSTESI